ncbi:MAG: BatA domain-containing protein [Longimicrobiales bacterium]|nr:BatA domain-containing protein [Longimicrobiales bacterium]
MGFLTPLFLVAAAAVAIPVLLHLLHLRSGKRQPFPALRYLRRTEKEHARRIRLRQLLLLLLRAAAILLLVAAGARLFLPDREGDHEPTALAIVLDNTVSTGVVVGEERVLDRLKRRALESVAAATPEDRIWVIRAGTPWETPLPGSPAAARARIEQTEPGGSTRNLAATVARARSLVSAAGLPAAEVHLLTDLQATALVAGDEGAETSGPAGEVPVLVLGDPTESPQNRYIAEAVVGGGLPPVVDEPTEVAVEVRISGRADEDSGPDSSPLAATTGDSVRIRLVIDDRTVSAAEAPLGATVLVPAGPFALEEVHGSVEIDPDRLRADDRRYFAFRVRPPARVGVGGDPGVFLSEALAVLEEGRRVRRVDPGSAEVLLASGGQGLTSTPPDVPAIIVPSDDPALLAATNRRLREAGIPWSLARGDTIGEVALEPTPLPVDVEGIRVRNAYRLERSEGGPPATILVRATDGAPWIVAGTSTGGRDYLVLASPLNPDATSLPVSPEMLPVVEWMVSGWPPTFRTRASTETGAPIVAPAEATRIRAPDGTTHPVDGGQPFQSTESAGIYTIFAGDSILARRAVNYPAEESLMERLDSREALQRLPPGARWVSDPGSWSREIFRQRRGREPWRLLLLAAILVLVGEALAAAGGRGSAPASTATPSSRANRPASAGRRA